MPTKPSGYGIFGRFSNFDKCRPKEIPPKLSEAVFSAVFLCYNFPPEHDNDIISGVAIQYVGVDVYIKFGDYRSNGFRNIRAATFVSHEHT